MRAHRTSPRFIIRAVEAFERTMPFSRPFRFGAVVVEAAPQAFVRVVIELPGHGRVTGVSAEMMMPKWFDKDPAKSPDDTLEDLRTSLRGAARGFAGQGVIDTAFGHHAAVLARQVGWARRAGITQLAANFGVALIDKAVLDALLKALGMGLLAGLHANVAGVDARLTPDLDDEEIDDFLAGLVPAGAVALRHTVGLADALDGANGLAGDLASAPLRHFKIKIGGDVAADLDRLRVIAALLDSSRSDYAASLDANEQYDPTRLARLMAVLSEDPALAGLWRHLLHIEQPFDRGVTFDQPLAENAIGVPVIIDEADDSYGAFPRAVALGYRGVSSKSCKGLYKAILNAVRVARLNRAHGGGYRLSGEDLTCQPGLAVQQDTALVATLGLTHVERNGHHYVDGFGPAPAAEAAAFAEAWPELYEMSAGRARLDTRNAILPTNRLLAGPGFASGAAPDWASLTPFVTEHSSQEIFA